MWAGGNLWLLGNTAFMFTETIHSWLLFLEWPFYLRHSILLRWWYIIVGSIYSAQLVSDFFAVVGMQDWETYDTYENYTFIDMFTTMFLAYNCLLHFPAVPITILLIAKEIEMMFFQIVTTNGPADY
jgi:hypothetical protein